MSELPPGVEPAEPPVPRESASAILVRQGADGVEVLLGIRSRRSRFMPGHLAFPGGVMDAVDGDGEERYARCASRELAEETGVEIDPEDWIAAGERITPPMFPVRFRTRFFVAPLPAGAAPSPVPEELESVQVAAAGGVVSGWRRGEWPVPPPVLPLLRRLAAADNADPGALAIALAEANAEEERAPRIEFVPGLWMLPVRTATLPPASHTNVWMPGERRFAMVDPGCGEQAEQRRLLAVVERRCEAGDEPVLVLLTHHHQDHTRGATAMARALGIPLAAHASVLAGLGEAHHLETIALEEGSSVPHIDVRAEVLHTPGHAPGHLAFHLVDQRLMIVGDLLSGTSTILVDPDGGDMGDYLASLRRVCAAGCRRLLPAHGPPLAAKAAAKLLEHRLQREAKVLRSVGDGAGLADIARAAYDDVPQMPLPLIERQTLSHLLWLEEQGRARSTGDGHWEPGAESVAQEIERRLREAFAPESLTIRDDSANHAGHAGATSGGGHFKVTIVAAAFAGLTLLEQHRRVNEVLREMFGPRIHALALKTSAPVSGGPGGRG